MELAQQGECVMNVSEVLPVSVSVASVYQEERWSQSVYAKDNERHLTRERNEKTARDSVELREGH